MQGLKVVLFGLSVPERGMVTLSTCAPVLELNTPKKTLASRCPAIDPQSRYCLTVTS